MAHVRYWRMVTNNVVGTPQQDRQLAEKRRRHNAFVTARLVLVALFVSLWVTLLIVGCRMPYGFLITLLAEIATLLIFFQIIARAKRERTLERMHYALVFCELGFHTAIVYFLGGVSWLGSMAYVFVLLYALVFSTRLQAAFFTALVVASFMTIVLLDATAVLPHQWYLPQDANRFQNPDFLVPTMAAFVGVIVTIAAWMVFIGTELRRETETALRANADLLQAQEQLRRLNDELERKVIERTEVLAFRAEHDQLTGLLNRGAVQRKCRELMALARRGVRPLAVIVADADDFKQCNDLGGHAYGDRVLRTLSRSLLESSRESDAVGRLGGDEFLIVLPDTTEDGAKQFCRRALKSLEERRGDWDEEGLPLPSVSMGIALYPAHGARMDDLVRIADHAMYRAKADGGACCQVGSEEDQVAVPKMDGGQAALSR